MSFVVECVFELFNVASNFAGNLWASWVLVPIFFSSGGFLPMISLTTVSFSHLTSCSQGLQWFLILFLLSLSQISLLFCSFIFRLFSTFYSFLSNSCSPWNSLIFCSTAVILILRNSIGLFFFNITYHVLSASRSFLTWLCYFLVLCWLSVSSFFYEFIKHYSITKVTEDNKTCWHWLCLQSHFSWWASIWFPHWFYSALLVWGIFVVRTF